MANKTVYNDGAHNGPIGKDAGLASQTFNQPMNTDGKVWDVTGSTYNSENYQIVTGDGSIVSAKQKFNSRKDTTKKLV